MELVYLWVEEYKNIEKQGFNFSPKFRCEFDAVYKENGELDEEKSKLIIKENPNYVSIFPENINITAIVGKNGSGKSSVLEILSLISIKDLDINVMIVFKGKNKFYLFSNLNNKFKIDCDFEIRKKNLNDTNLNIVFFSTNFTNGILDNKYNYFSTLKYKFFLNEDNDDINFRNQSLFSFFYKQYKIFF